MGGRTSLVVAGRVPDRVAAAMSFHGGGLAADGDPAARICWPTAFVRWRFYVGGAERSSTPSAVRDALDAALTSAGVEHVIEWYRPHTDSPSPTTDLTTRTPPKDIGGQWNSSSNAPQPERLNTRRTAAITPRAA